MWRKLHVEKPGIRLDLTLQSGQSFRWRQTKPGEWTNVLCGFVWTLKQVQNEIFYLVFKSKTSQRPRGQRILEEINSSGDEGSTFYESILRDYFQLDVDLESLCQQWKAKDSFFAQVSEKTRGLRVLRQDPVENLFAFICSSNNNIPRISGMVETLCQTYGERLGELNGVDYYTFPDIKDLTGAGVEQRLRAMGFGYRAKFINQSACYILQHHDRTWLESLRSISYEEAHKALCQLPGVGAKVADCVCLMSLDKHEAVPVDTHVWQITAKHYMTNQLKTKSLTAKVYKEIGDHYRSLFGKYAGWAQSVLFAADLKRFQSEDQPKLKEEVSKRKATAQSESSVTKRKKKKH